MPSADTGPPPASGPKPLTAAILAGGLGTRLRSLVPDQPKALAEVSGRPFLAFLLDQLADEGVESVVLCTGFKGDQVANQFGTGHRGMQLQYSKEPAALGTGGALRLALPMIKADAVLVLNGDSYCDAPLQPFRRWHELRRARASLVLTEEPDTRRYGRVEVDSDQRIVQFHEKANTVGPGWINAGVYLLARDVIEDILPDATVSLEREVFPALIGRGLFGYQSEGRVWDIGTPESYVLANSDSHPAFGRNRFDPPPPSHPLAAPPPRFEAD